MGRRGPDSGGAAPYCNDSYYSVCGRVERLPLLSFIGGSGRRGEARVPAATPRAALSRSPTLSPPARESRDARRLRLTHSVAVRVCVPSVIRYRSSIEQRAVPPQPVPLLGSIGPSPATVVPVLLTPLPKAQLTGVSAAYERTVSADRSLHARARHRFTCLFRVARKIRPSMDRMYAIRRSPPVVTAANGR